MTPQADPVLWTMISPVHRVRAESFGEIYIYSQKDGRGAQRGTAVEEKRPPMYPPLPRCLRGRCPARGSSAPRSGRSAAPCPSQARTPSGPRWHSRRCVPAAQGRPRSVLLAQQAPLLEGRPWGLGWSWKQRDLQDSSTRERSHPAAQPHPHASHLPHAHHGIGHKDQHDDQGLHEGRHGLLALLEPGQDLPVKRGSAVARVCWPLPLCPGSPVCSPALGEDGPGGVERAARRRPWLGTCSLCG